MFNYVSENGEVVALEVLLPDRIEVVDLPSLLVGMGEKLSRGALQCLADRRLDYDLCYVYGSRDPLPDVDVGEDDGSGEPGDDWLHGSDDSPYTDYPEW